MRRQGSGFGFVMLLVVVAIVLFLASRALRATLPAATALAHPSPSGGEVAEPAAAGGGETIRPGRMPDLKVVKQETDAHAAEVRDAVEKTAE